MNIYDEVKVITHEEARRFVNMKFQEKIGWAVPKQIRDPLNAYITEQEAKDKAHDELVMDVKRYFELCSIECKDYSSDEYYALKDKLMKAGKKE